MTVGLTCRGGSPLCHVPVASVCPHGIRRHPGTQAGMLPRIWDLSPPTSQHPHVSLGRDGHRRPQPVGTWGSQCPLCLGGITLAGHGGVGGLPKLLPPRWRLRLEGLWGKGWGWGRGGKCPRSRNGVGMRKGDGSTSQALIRTP